MTQLIIKFRGQEYRPSLDTDTMDIIDEIYSILIPEKDDDIVFYSESRANGAAARERMISFSALFFDHYKKRVKDSAVSAYMLCDYLGE